jgi:sulfur-oxidizing protein SoxY
LKLKLNQTALSVLSPGSTGTTKRRFLLGSIEKGLGVGLLRSIAPVSLLFSTPFHARAESVLSPVQDATYDQSQFLKAFNELTQSQPVTQGGITLETPRLADNGHSAALRVFVPSPMTEDDHIVSVVILSDRNPRPFVARYEFTPFTPLAEVNTRVRLNGSQNVYALALNSKQQWCGVHVPVEVTESACLDAS